jgi:hypothetical protein
VFVMVQPPARSRSASTPRAFAGPPIMRAF